jgi:eukaryotic-like serine/threonine-protein kinase
MRLYLVVPFPDLFLKHNIPKTFSSSELPQTAAPSVLVPSTEVPNELELLRHRFPFPPSVFSTFDITVEEVLPRVNVGRYQVLETLGTGASSRVVRGYDPLIDRQVAIKLFSPELARGEARSRFLREARVVGKLAHPFIIALHDMGIEETTSTPYLVMELVEGQPLEKMLSKGSVPFPTACAWAAEVATALGVAHRRGVIHGDVKPANILVSSDSHTKLTDFGMARLASHDKQDTSLLGTPAYWCPEQIMGRPQDARSDLFSLGVVLYEMLTGISPFAAESLNGVCSHVLSSTPLPPSTCNPSIPTPVDAVVASCLVKDPQHRIFSAEALADQLYPLARRKTAPQAATQEASLRTRAMNLLRSA